MLYFMSLMSKKLEEHLKFDKQAKLERRIWAAFAAASVARDKKK